MTLRERIINELHKMYEKLDGFQETTFFQENEEYMYECGEAMGAIDNLIDLLEKPEPGTTIYTVDCDIQWDIPYPSSEVGVPSYICGYKVYVEAGETLAKKIVSQLTGQYGYSVNGVGYDIKKTEVIL